VLPHVTEDLLGVHDACVTYVELLLECTVISEHLRPVELHQIVLCILGWNQDVHLYLPDIVKQLHINGHFLECRLYLQ